MKKPVIIKFISLLLNLLTYLTVTVITLIRDNWYQSGDTYALIIWTTPLALVIAVSGDSILNIIKTSIRFYRVLLILISAFVFSLAWFYIVALFWGDWHLPFNVPMFYLWIVGSCVQLLFLDRYLPKQTEKINLWKLLFRLIVLPLTIIAVLYILLLFVMRFA